MKPEELSALVFKKVHKPTYPAVSVIMPFNLERTPNPIMLCENDEGIIVIGGQSIGHARIRGAKEAKNKWLVFVDSDAWYPPEYILQVKEYIRKLGEEHPILATKRYGGLLSNPPPHKAYVYEHGLIVRKDVFLERVKNYPENAPRRTDIGGLFKDAYPINVPYYHPATHGEKTLLTTLISLTIPLTLILKK